jgi:hypothetical protein
MRASELEHLIQDVAKAKTRKDVAAAAKGGLLEVFVDLTNGLSAKVVPAGGYQLVETRLPSTSKLSVAPRPRALEDDGTS